MKVQKFNQLFNLSSNYPLSSIRSNRFFPCPSSTKQEWINNP